MKEYKSKDIMPVTTLDRKIWTIFDILRGESIASEEYYVVLFLLSLYKDGIISKDTLSNQGNVHEDLIDSIQDANEKTAQQYLPIYQSFESALKDISSKGLLAIIQVMSNIDNKILSENFSDIYDNVLYLITQSLGRFGGELIQPLELTRLIITLADLSASSSVYNPFAGLASFAVYLNNDQEYFGQEINPKTWALGALRIMAHANLRNSRYQCDDSILNWPDQSEKFDAILASPPYGMRLSHQYSEFEPRIRTVEQFLIEKGVDSLNAKGKLIALLPQGFLFRGMHEKTLREKLIKNDLIDTIISLPGGLLLNTGIPLIVLVINKDKKLPGKVRFIDATKFVESKGPRGKVLNDYKLATHIRQNKNEYFTGKLTDDSNMVAEPYTTYQSSNEDQIDFNDKDIVRIVDVDQIKQYDYNLNVPRYLTNEIIINRDEHLVKLKAILEYVKGKRGNLPEKGKLVRIRDLKDDQLNYQLDLSNIDQVELRKNGISMHDKSCLLIASRWKTLKPTHFEFKADPIYLNQDILAFMVNEELVNQAYLVSELHSDYIQKQLEAARTGTTVPMIRRDDLLNVQIKLPSLLEQDRIVDRRKMEVLNTATEQLKELQRQLGRDVADENSFLRHQIAGTLKNMRVSLSGIQTIVENKILPIMPEVMNEKVSEKRSQTFGDYLAMVARDLDKVSRTVRNTNKGYDLSEYKLTDLKFLELVKRYFKELKERERDHIEISIHIDHLSFNLDEITEVIIQGNEDLLYQALNNLVENAKKHGFHNYTGPHKIRIDVLFDRESDQIQLDVCNTGNLMIEGISVEDYARKGSKFGISGGDGLGGWYVNEIMKIHRGRLSFTNEQGPEGIGDDWATSIELYFPISQFITNSDV